MIAPPKKMKTKKAIKNHGPPRLGPMPSDENHEPARVSALGPVSQRLVSRSAPQMAHPAANGLTGSRQLGQRLRSGITHRIAIDPKEENWTFVYELNDAACDVACAPERDAACRGAWSAACHGGHPHDRAGASP